MKRGSANAATWTSGRAVFGDDHLGTPPERGAFGDICHAVIDHALKALVGKHRFGEFRTMLLGGFDHRRVDLDLGDAFDGFVLEGFFGDAAVAAAPDKCRPLESSNFWRKSA
jgi:hypothetical protein